MCDLLVWAGRGELNVSVAFLSVEDVECTQCEIAALVSFDADFEVDVLDRDNDRALRA